MAKTGRNCQLGASNPLTNKLIYVSIIRHGEPCTEWYKMDLSTSSKDSSKRISQFATSGLDRGICYAASGSALYSVGGYTINYETYRVKYSRSVSCFDRHKQEDGFKRFPDMLTARSNCYAMVLQQKLFVFGGCDRNKLFAEFYNLDEGMGGNWVEINPPTSLVRPFFFVIHAVAYGDNRIFVVFKKSSKAQEENISFHEEVIFFYNIESSSWEEHGEPGVGMAFRIERPIIVGNTLYWLRTGNGLCLYNLISRQFSQIYLKELMGLDVDYPPIVHLGGELFCTLFIEKGFGSHLSSALRVLIFRVRGLGDGCVDASVFSTLSFPTECRRDDFDIREVISMDCDTEKTRAKENKAARGSGRDGKGNRSAGKKIATSKRTKVKRICVWAILKQHKFLGMALKKSAVKTKPTLAKSSGNGGKEKCFKNKVNSK